MKNKIQQGWECPKCGNVYNPSVKECVNCSKTSSKPGFNLEAPKEDKYMSYADWRPGMMQCPLCCRFYNTKIHCCPIVTYSNTYYGNLV